MDKSKDIKDVDSYIKLFPSEISLKLSQLRKLIKATVPNAVETIKYQMPTYVLKKNLVHFAGYRNHIGFYPSPSGITPFLDELKRYKTSKGAIQFPINEELPLPLIKKIVEYRVKEDSKIR